MAGGEGDGATLRLIIEKGPSEGQTHEFKPRPRSEIRIGRIVSGNKLTIKDKGISSKHASIRFDSRPDSPTGFWVISDLESSNGTVLNDRVLDPFTPVALSDADVIKIGEFTSIVVRLEDVRVGVEEGNGRRRRIPLPTIRYLESPLGGEDVGKRNFKGRNTRGKAASGRNEAAEASSNRVTRNATRKEIGVQSELLQAENMGRGPRSRRNENVGADAEVGGKGKGTKRNAKKDHALEFSSGNEFQNGGAVEMLLPAEEKIDVQNMSLRRSARNLRKERNLDSFEENGEHKPQSRRGIRGRRKNLGMETLNENDDEAAEKLNSEVEVLQDMNEGLGEEGEGIHSLVEEEGLQAAAEGSQALVSTSGLAKENGDIDVDLEKMTLGEWFDFLEVYLPKQIIDETEKMILDMKQISEKFHYFVSQQKRKNVEELG